jgi:plastocyanin
LFDSLFNTNTFKMYASNIITAALIPAAMAYSYGGSAAKTGKDSETIEQTEAATSGIHVVKVGGDGLVMTPSELTAQVGEKVEFHFGKGQHSVAQSSFDNPCQPLNTTGFFSGKVPVTEGWSENVFTVEIKDDKPLWYYCATAKHCQAGMVGVINAPASGARTLQQYSDAAKEAKENTEPSATGGGVLGAPQATPGAPSTSAPPEGAGPQTFGSVSWGLMSFGVALVGFVGGLAL